MKKIKKISFVCLLTILCSLFVFNTINVLATGNRFTFSGGAYTETEVLDEYDFGYGISFKRVNGKTSVTKSGFSSGVAFNDEAPQQVHLLTVTPSENVELVPYTVLEGGQWQAVPVKKAALQYETTHPGYKVVAAVNGDFFKINNAVKASTGVTISQGEYFKSTSNHSKSSINTLAIRNNGEGKQLFTANISKSYPMLSIYDENDNIVLKVDINKVNKEPGDNEISVYYSQRKENFERDLEYVSVSNAWYIEQALYGVTSIKNSFYGVGNITGFTNSEIELKQNQFAIKCNNEEVNKLLKTDVKIRVQYEYKDSTVEGVENFIGFPYQLMQDGVHIAEDQPSNSNGMYRHPRTMVGQKENGDIVLAVVDGRQTNKDMYGVTAVEMSAILAYEGCIDAWNLDGGGSSTMIVRKQHGWDFGNENNGFNKDNSSWYITNSPSDGSERSDGNHLLVVVKLPEVTLDIDSATTDSITLNVALLSDLDKYSNLYILLENEYYLVQDGKVTISGLKKDTEYDVFLYSKVDDKYINLMTSDTYYTNKNKPTSIDVGVSLFTSNNSEQILFRYKVDNPEAVRKIVFVDKNGERYLTTSQMIRLEKTYEMYELLHTGKIEITYIDNPLFPENVLILEDFSMKYELMFLVDEMLFTTNDIIENMFK